MQELRTEGKFIALLAKMRRRSKKWSRSAHWSLHHLAPCGAKEQCLWLGGSVCQMAGLHRECQHGSGILRRLQHCGSQPSNHRRWEVPWFWGTVPHVWERWERGGSFSPPTLPPSATYRSFSSCDFSSTNWLLPGQWKTGGNSKRQRLCGLLCPPSYQTLIPVQLLSLGRAAVHQVCCLPRASPRRAAAQTSSSAWPRHAVSAMEERQSRAAD